MDKKEGFGHINVGLAVFDETVQNLREKLSSSIITKMHSMEPLLKGISSRVCSIAHPKTMFPYATTSVDQLKLKKKIIFF